MGIKQDDKMRQKGQRSRRRRRNSSNRLSLEHVFSHRNLLQNPKVIRRQEFQGTEYQTLHTGGFLRLCTLRCRMYWCQQNTLQHTSADWKLHFSVHWEDLGLAWDCVAAQFLKHQLQFGMKVIYMEKQLWPSTQRGREITVYIYKHDSHYDSAMEGMPYTAKEVADMQLGEQFEIESERLCKFITDTENALEVHQVRTAGCADGDYALGKYVSVRNEAFTLQQIKQPSDGRTVQTHLMPPNESGWNAAGHALPTQLSQLQQRGKHNAVYKVLMLCAVICVAILFSVLAWTDKPI